MIGPRAVLSGEVPLSRRADAFAASRVVPVPAADDVVLVVRGPGGDDTSLGRESNCVVARLVLAGIAARLELSVAAIERLQLALDELLRWQQCDAPATVEFTCSEDELTFSVGPLVLRLPDRRRLERRLEAAADHVVWGDDPRGAWVLARMSRRSSDQTRR